MYCNVLIIVHRYLCTVMLLCTYWKVSTVGTVMYVYYVLLCTDYNRYLRTVLQLCTGKYPVCTIQLHICTDQYVLLCTDHRTRSCKSILLPFLFSLIGLLHLYTGWHKSPCTYRMVVVVVTAGRAMLNRLVLNRSQPSWGHVFIL